MALGNLFGRRKGRKDTDAGDPGVPPADPEPTEVGLTLLLGDSRSGRTYSPEYVRGLRNRVAGAAMSELDQLLDPAWYRELAALGPEQQAGQVPDPAWRRGFPEFTLGLEGPTMGVQLVIVKVPEWDLRAIATQVHSVFTRHWDAQIDRDRA
jgi:hypothetical protein